MSTDCIYDVAELLVIFQKLCDLCFAKSKTCSPIGRLLLSGPLNKELERHQLYRFNILEKTGINFKGSIWKDRDGRSICQQMQSSFVPKDVNLFSGDTWNTSNIMSLLVLVKAKCSTARVPGKRFDVCAQHNFPHLQFYKALRHEYVKHTLFW